MRQNRQSVMIGITGGVGAGKSTVVRYLEENYGAEVFIADQIGQMLQQPGTDCYDRIIRQFGREILDQDGTIIREKLSGIVFADQNKLAVLDAIVHPAVREWIEERISELDGPLRLFVIEAALLIEAGYEDLCDEIWYVYADEKTRAGRLMSTRGYTPEHIRQIMDNQLSDEEFRSNSQRVIDNSSNPSHMKKAVDLALSELLKSKKQE